MCAADSLVHGRYVKAMQPGAVMQPAAADVSAVAAVAPCAAADVKWAVLAARLRVRGWVCCRLGSFSRAGACVIIKHDKQLLPRPQPPLLRLWVSSRGYGCAKAFQRPRVACPKLTAACSNYLSALVVILFIPSCLAIWTPQVSLKL